MWIHLKNGTAPELHAALAPLGVTLRTARRLQAAAVRRDEIPAHLPEVSDQVLARVREAVRLPRLRVEDKRVSARDGFAKYVFEGEGEGLFEAVRIPLVHRAGTKSMWPA
jgi:hypothetical protein